MISQFVDMEEIAKRESYTNYDIDLLMSQQLKGQCIDSINQFLMFMILPQTILFWIKMNFFKRIGTTKKKFKVEFILEKLITNVTLTDNITIQIKRGSHKQQTQPYKFEDEIIEFGKQNLTFDPVTMFYDDDSKTYMPKEGEIRVIIQREDEKKTGGVIQFDLAEIINRNPSQTTSHIRKKGELFTSKSSKVKFELTYQVNLRYLRDTNSEVESDTQTLQSNKRLKKGKQRQSHHKSKDKPSNNQQQKQEKRKVKQQFKSKEKENSKQKEKQKEKQKQKQKKKKNKEVQNQQNNQQSERRPKQAQQQKLKEKVKGKEKEKEKQKQKQKQEERKKQKQKNKKPKDYESMSEQQKQQKRQNISKRESKNDRVEKQERKRNKKVKNNEEVGKQVDIEQPNKPATFDDIFNDLVKEKQEVQVSDQIPKRSKKQQSTRRSKKERLQNEIDHPTIKQSNNAIEQTPTNLTKFGKTQQPQQSIVRTYPFDDKQSLSSLQKPNLPSKIIKSPREGTLSSKQAYYVQQIQKLKKLKKDLELKNDDLKEKEEELKQSIENQQKQRNSNTPNIRATTFNSVQQFSKTIKQLQGKLTLIEKQNSIQIIRYQQLKGKYDQLERMIQKEKIDAKDQIKEREQEQKNQLSVQENNLRLLKQKELKLTRDIQTLKKEGQQISNTIDKISKSDNIVRLQKIEQSLNNERGKIAFALNAANQEGNGELVQFLQSNLEGS